MGRTLKTTRLKLFLLFLMVFSVEGKASYYFLTPLKLWRNIYALNFGSSNATKYLGGGTSGQNLSWSSPFTMSFWLAFESTGGGIIVSKENGLGTGWDLRVTSDKLQWYSSPNAAATRIQWTTTNTFTRSTYHHICLVYSGNSSATGFSLYVDNSSAAITTNFNTSAADWTNSTALNFGTYNSGAGAFYPGKLDEFNIYNTNLSSTQCTELYNSGHPGNPVNVSSWGNNTSYWRMGDNPDSTSTIYDRGRVGGVPLTPVNVVSGDFTTTVP